jgi:hypothetical protein
MSDLDRLILERDVYKAALLSIAEGNLGPASWQASYAKIAEAARSALLAGGSL